MKTKNSLNDSLVTLLICEISVSLMSSRENCARNQQKKRNMQAVWANILRETVKAMKK